MPLLQHISNVLKSGIVVLLLPFLLQEDHLPPFPVKALEVYDLLVFF